MTTSRVIAALVVVVAVCGVLWLSKTRVEPGEPPALRSSVQPSTREAEAPRPKLAQQPVLKPSPDATPSNATDNTADNAPAQGHAMELEHIPPPHAMGAIRERKTRFADESPAETSPAREAKLKAAIEPVAPPGLLEDTLCRRTICRVRMEWKADRAIALLSVLSELRSKFDPELGVDEPSALEPNGTRRIDVYLQVPGTPP
jgi:hypothetical protein